MDSSLKYVLSKTLLVTGLVLLASACHYQDYNHIEQQDVREGQAYIYGEDSLPRQSKNKYTAKPELEQRAAAIREKLFGGADSAKASN